MPSKLMISLGFHTKNFENAYEIMGFIISFKETVSYKIPTPTPTPLLNPHAQ